MKELDLTDTITENIIVERNRDLNKNLECYIISDCTELPFSFSGWTGATMEVRTKPDNIVVLSFSTNDNSIHLFLNGIITLKKTAAQMFLRSGEYEYDMYLSSSTESKRGFLKGKFIVQSTISK